MGVLSWIQQAAAVHPEGGVVDGCQAYSIRELLGAADFFSRELPPGPLAMQAPNGLEAILAVLAAQSAGSDLLLLDPSLQEQEVRDACSRAGTATLLVRPGDAVDGLTCLEIPPPSANRAGPVPARPPRSAGFMLLSSGTTGPPRIVLRKAAQTLAALELFREAVPLGPADRVLAALPFCHSFGLLFVLLGALGAGAQLHVGPFTPRGSARLIEERRITVLPATPFMFRLLTETAFDPPPDFSRVRLAISAGSRLPEGVAGAFLAKFGVPILQSYGSTEAGPVTLARPGNGAGRPYAGVDLDLGTEGDPRPIFVRSPALAEGYVGDEQATAQVFRPEGVAIGDLGYRDGRGCVVVVGRDRPLLSVGGKKVSPAEIEACLKSHPAVADAVVVGVPAKDGGDTLKAILVAGPGLTVQEVQTHVADRLAAFKVPRKVSFAGEEALTLLGKIKIRTPQ